MTSRSKVQLYRRLLRRAEADLREAGEHRTTPQHAGAYELLEAAMDAVGKAERRLEQDWQQLDEAGDVEGAAAADAAFQLVNKAYREMLMPAEDILAPYDQEYQRPTQRSIHETLRGPGRSFDR